MGLRIWGLRIRGLRIRGLKIFAVTLLLLFCAASASAEEKETADWSLSGSLTAASDYIYHGISQTGGTGAWQAGVTLSGPAGFYGSVWTSRVRYPTTPDIFAEVDLIAGWNGDIEDWNVDISTDVVYYPSGSAHVGYDNTEFFLALSRDFGKFHFCFTGGYSPDFSNHSGTWITTQADLSYPLAENLSVTAGAGYETIEDNVAYGLPDYYNGKIGLQYVMGDWTLDSTLTWTGLSRSQCGATDLCAPRFTAGLTYAF